jgi:hypothetical protein
VPLFFVGIKNKESCCFEKYSEKTATFPLLWDKRKGIIILSAHRRTVVLKIPNQERSSV